LTGSDVGDISPLVTTGTGTGTGTIIPNGQSGTTPPLIEVYNAEGQNDSLLGMNRNILAARLTPFARPVIVIAQKIAGRLSPVLTSTTGLLTVLVALSEAGSLAAVASTPGGLASLGRALFPFLAVRPRPSPWGRVVEEGTNRPVSNVVLTIMDEAGKVRATTKSQTNGTFGVLLPRGTYHLTVTAPGYALASAPSSVPLFPNELLYTGGTFTVAQDEVVLPLVVVLRAENPAMARGKASKKGEFMTKARLWQAHWAIPLLLIGAALHTLALVQNPTYPLITIGLLYIFFLILELLLSRVVRRAIGRVYDHLQHRPVPLALVRLLEPITNRVVATEVTTTKGQFLMMPPPGVYRLQVMHSQYDPYLKDSLRISKWNAGVAPVTVELHSPQPTPPSAPHVSWVPGLQQTA
jgi:hypothetical protein